METITNFLGEYECKLDDKGRLKLPSAILNKLGDSSSRDFIIKRGFEHCLLLYPRESWNVQLRQVQGLNDYIPEVREFRRIFYRGATEFTPDKADRILLPKLLLDHAGIDKTLIISGVGTHLEIWSPESHQDMINKEVDASALAEKMAQYRTKRSDE